MLDEMIEQLCEVTERYALPDGYRATERLVHGNVSAQLRFDPLLDTLRPDRFRVWFHLAKLQTIHALVKNGLCAPDTDAIIKGRKSQRLST